MNKSLVTNSVAIVVCILGYAMPESSLRPFVVSAGLFSLSGALTNWLAIYMLFEKIPGLYGSGVIVARFQEFKSSIHSLVLENFFNEENFKQFADAAIHQGLTSETIESVVDMDQAFDGFLDVIGRSKFGSMLAFVGGLKAIEPLREPFKAEFSARFVQVIEDLDLTNSNMHFETFRPTVENLVQGKLDQLKPQEVKTILEKIIREHLGWLVVWGGVFGTVIGILHALAKI